MNTKSNTSQDLSTNIIPKPLKPLNEMPRWAYSEPEWCDVEDKTMEIIDGIRMVYDYAEWNRLKYRDQNKLLDSLGLI